MVEVIVVVVLEGVVSCWRALYGDGGYLNPL